MILNSENQKADIDYPCEWHYKIIGDNVIAMQKIIRKAVNGMQHDLQASNISKKGKYKSLSLKVIVNDEAERDMIYGMLIQSDSIKMIL
ncbi:MAG: DUF493 domain-containing protein [Melioribacteraceae bacterium]|nr:DUF493 domain-containing protein [Melioribacteraceae bacterium]